MIKRGREQNLLGAGRTMGTMALIRARAVLRSSTLSLNGARALSTLLAVVSLAMTPALWPNDARAQSTDGDPLNSFQWPFLKQEYLGKKSKIKFDERVVVQGPGFAEDAMNVPISFDARAISEIDRIVVMVDRNPIKRVLEFQPQGALPVLSFRFKLEQSSPVRVAVHTRKGVWHVGHTWVDATGGGCTVPGATRADGTWNQTLGQVSAKIFTLAAKTEEADSPEPSAGAASVPGGERLRIRIMHPMDTGLVAGIPAFFIRNLQLENANGQGLAKVTLFEPVSENPMLSFDFASPPARPLRIVGADNNGNRIRAEIAP